MGRKDKVVPFEAGETLPLGARLRYARQREGLSLTQMAKDLGYTKSHLSAVENGTGRPSGELVERYERRLGLGLGELVHGENDRASLGRRHTPLPGADQARAGEKREREAPTARALPGRVLASGGHVEDWGEAPTIRSFYGRRRELADLRRWAVEEQCRVIAISGIGGVGKTALASVSSRELPRGEGGFSALLWRSLRDSPSVEEVLRRCIRSLSGQRLVDFPTEAADQITLFITYLQRRRCLVVFDNFEAVLQPGSLSGEYRAGYEAYGEVIDRVGRAQHQSCLLLTSREKSKEVVRLEVEEAGVRSLVLSGLQAEEGRSMLLENHLAGSDGAFAELIRRYSGNPLALRLIAASVRDLFDGSIDAFLEAPRSGGELEEEAILLGDVAGLVGQQFQRLSEQEQDIMSWLAIEREAVSPGVLQDDSIRLVSRGSLFQALEMLRHRSMIETAGGGRFTLQPAIMEYVTERLLSQVCAGIIQEDVEALTSYPLIKAQAKDYVRSIQTRVMLAPVAHRLLIALGKEESEKKLRTMLDHLRQMYAHTPGYAAGNILNLLIQLGCDLRGYDFSHLAIWQASLQRAKLPGVNFAQAELDGVVFTDTFERVLTARLSPDGTRLAIGTGNGDVCIWDVAGATLTPLRICRGHTDFVRSIAFSHDGTTLVSGSEDQTIRQWDVETGECLATLQESSRVLAVDVHRDGDVLAAGKQDATVRLWDLRSGQCLHTLEGHTYRVWAVAFSPDGKTLASGSSDSTARLWDVKTGACLQELKWHRHRVRSVAFSTDGALLASASKDCTVGIWDVKTGRRLRELRGPARGFGFRSVAFSPIGRLVAAGSDDRIIRLWDAETGRWLRTIEGHTNWIRSVAFAPDGRTIVSSSEDQTVRLWEVETGLCLRALQGYSEWIYAVAFSPDGTVIATGGGEWLVRLWSAGTGKPIRALVGHKNWIRSVAFSPDGKLLAAGGEDRLVCLWDAGTGECLRKLEEHTSWVYAVTFSPDGKLLASGSEDHTVCLWDVSTGHLLQTLRGRPDWIRSVAFSPDGKLLASGSDDRTVCLWEVETGQLLTTLEGSSGGIYAVAFSPDGKTVVSGSEDGVVALWEMETKECYQMLHGHRGRVWSIIFSPDGRTLASGGEDRSVRLWDLETGQSPRIFAGFNNRVYSIAFSPDGRTVAGGSPDGTVKLWTVATGELVRTLRNERPYEGMNIAGVQGLVPVQKDMLKTLGSVEW